MHTAKSHLGRNRAAALLLAVLMAGFAWPLLAADAGIDTINDLYPQQRSL